MSEMVEQTTGWSRQSPAPRVLDEPEVAWGHKPFKIERPLEAPVFSGALRAQVPERILRRQ
eukprot:2661738-Pyramimonas_sp.AAC.1